MLDAFSKAISKANSEPEPIPEEGIEWADELTGCILRLQDPELEAKYICFLADLEQSKSSELVKFATHELKRIRDRYGYQLEMSDGGNDDSANATNAAANSNSANGA